MSRSDMAARRLGAGLLFSTLGALALSSPVSAQLSPGQLSESHVAMAPDPTSARSICRPGSPEGARLRVVIAS